MVVADSQLTLPLHISVKLASTLRMQVIFGQDVPTMQNKGRGGGSFAHFENK